VDKDPTRRSETPRSEPEIILPGESARRPRGDARIWVSMTDAQGRALSAPSPFKIAAILIGVLIAVTVILVFVLGALLFWIPIVAVVLAAFIVVGLIKGYFRQAR
jgi:hypothetical protein